MNYDWTYIASGAVALAVIAAIVLILAFAVFGKRESMTDGELDFSDMRFAPTAREILAEEHRRKQQDMNHYPMMV